MMSYVTVLSFFRTTFFLSELTAKNKISKNILHSAFAIYSPLYLSGSAARQDILRRAALLGLGVALRFFLQE
jgi:hypothetical protein